MAALDSEISGRFADLSVGFDPGGDISFLNVTGDVDVSTADSLRTRLLALLKRAPRRMVIRLKHVGYMDSAGVAVLLELIQAARAASTEILLVEPSQASRRALGMVDIEALVTLYESMDDCAECIHAPVSTVRGHLCTPEELVRTGSGTDSQA